MEAESWHSQNSLFKHFQTYLGIFRDTDAYSAILTGVQLWGGGGGLPPLPFLTMEKKTLIMSIFGLHFPFKMFRVSTRINSKMFPCHRALFSHIQAYSEHCATLAYTAT